MATLDSLTADGGTVSVVDLIVVKVIADRPRENTPSTHRCTDRLTLSHTSSLCVTKMAQ